jgi:hypothetical protein
VHIATTFILPFDFLKEIAMPRLNSMRSSPFAPGFVASDPMHGIVVVAINEPPFGDQRTMPIGMLMKLSAQYQAMQNLRVNEGMLSRQVHDGGFQYEAQPNHGRSEVYPQQPPENAASIAPDMQAEKQPMPAGSNVLFATARKLMPEPGIWKVLRYSDFVDLLSPQLQNPGRLQPRHQLACYVQVYELVAPCGLTALEDKTTGELGKFGKIKLLSHDLCRQFSFNLPRQPLALTDTRGSNSTGLLPAGARFITLRVAIDPTAEQSQKSEIKTDAQQPGKPPKFIVPTQSAKPWEICIRRDEAVYDMMVAANASWIKKLVKRLWRRIPTSQIRKWQALLVGKSLEQQLWQVRPPKGALNCNYVRRWLTQVLQLGGYDVPRMSKEWEIFWRQRGL